MKITLLLGVTLFSLNTFGSETGAVKSFDEIWQSFYQKSHLIQEGRREYESDTYASDRAKRHWLPRVYLTGQILNSDDPGQVLFSNLGQRAVSQSDFAPDTLNNPARQTFKTGTLGLDLPLYEGGFKAAQESMLGQIMQASAIEIEAKRTSEYAELSRQYGGMLIYSKSSTNLLELKSALNQIIATYQVGAKSNPVGHSGLLGLKAVVNRISGMMAEFKMQISVKKIWIDKKAEIDSAWIPNEKTTLQEYLAQNLQSVSNHPHSALYIANQMKTDAFGQMRAMEKARFLPRVGLFAQNNLYDGSRDTQNSQAFGLYLTWDIFNSDSYGRVSEAQAKIQAGQEKMRAAEQDELIMMNNLVESKKVLEENLEILADTDGLLKEQSLNAMKLFKSGLLSALQLSEVINRRVDLIESKNKVENQYLDVWSHLYQLKN